MHGMNSAQTTAKNSTTDLNLELGDTPFEEAHLLEQKKPKTWAAGNHAVTSSLKHVFSQADPLRGTKALLGLNQFGGFDCPSCAWPDPDEERAITEFCENGAKAIASEATSRTITPEFFQEYSINDLLSKSDYWYEQQGRLTQPVIRREGATHFEVLEWEEAFKIIGKELKSLPSKDDAIFYTSGRASNEAAFLYQLFVRKFGTNNLPDCSNMCHESSGAAMTESIGVGKGTVTLDDFKAADIVFCIGQNPGTNHPRMLSALESTVEHGGKVIAVNPLVEAGLLGFAHPQKVSGMLNKSTSLASEYLQVKPNGDFALIRGVNKAIFELMNTKQGLIDWDFVENETQGFKAFETAVKGTSWEDIVAKSGISKEVIKGLAQTIAKTKKRIITCWAMGITQQKNAVATIQEITNLHLMLGAIGKEGAGLCPVRGHSNVQGDRTMGVFEKMPKEFHDRLDKVFKFKSPRAHGYDVVSAIKAMHAEAGKIFIGLGGNFLQASPDTRYTAQALKNCRLTAHIGTKLNRGHLVTGEIGLILPCLGRSDVDHQATGPQFISCENSMSIVHMSKGTLEPVSDNLKSEVAIITHIAEATLRANKNLTWETWRNDYDQIRKAVEKTIPGFENFNARVRQDEGFYLPNTAKERVWETATKKANFSNYELSSFEVAKGHLILQTLRSHDQYNTTVYGMHDRYRGIAHARRIIFINPEDLKELNIKPMQLVDITSHWGDETRTIVKFQAIAYDMPRGAAAAYFPEANPLVAIDSIADISLTPTSKAIEISIKPSH